MAEGRSARKDSRSVKNPRNSDVGAEPTQSKSTPFLRFRPGENSATLDQDEVIIFNPRKKAPTGSVHLEQRRTRNSRPLQIDVSFQIAAISYEVFLDGKLVNSGTKLSDKLKDLEVHSDEAENILQKFSPHDSFSKLSESFFEFLKN